MIPFFPKQISYRAIATYVVALAAVSVFYVSFAMKIGYIALGMTCVLGFFLLTSTWSRDWRSISEKQYVKYVFLLAVSLRIVWVIASYFYYTQATGRPFEIDTGDALGYHEEAQWLLEEGWSYTWDYYFGSAFRGISDVGYPLYLTLIYSIFGPNVIIPRIFKAFMGSYTCVLIYRLSARTFEESTGRIAGIMTALMPNLIIYCGYHLKEIEMIFLSVAFLERTDYLLRSRRMTFGNILVASFFAMSLFFFRTVLGAAAVFAFVTAILFSSTPTMKRGWKRTALIGWGILCLFIASGGTIITEIESYWEGRNENVTNKRLDQTLAGNQWAQYATGAVMAPMVFVLPFATMVDVDQQYAQQTKHGGNFVRNFMGFFAIIAVYEAFRRKKWRDFSLIGAFVVAYLGVVSLSGFSNSERFLLPGLPCLIMMWAYGVSTLRRQTFKLLTPWCLVVVAMEFAWAFFKLGSRGLF